MAPWGQKSHYPCCFISWNIWKLKSLALTNELFYVSMNAPRFFYLNMAVNSIALVAKCKAFKHSLLPNMKGIYFMMGSIPQRFLDLMRMWMTGFTIRALQAYNLPMSKLQVTIDTPNLHLSIRFHLNNNLSPTLHKWNRQRSHTTLMHKNRKWTPQPSPPP